MNTFHNTNQNSKRDRFILQKALGAFLTAALLLTSCSALSNDNSNQNAPTPPPSTPLPTFAPAASPSPLAATQQLPTAGVTQPAPGAPTEEIPSTGITQSPSAAQKTPLPTPVGTAVPTAAASPQNAQNFPDPSGYTWEKVVSGLTSPVGIMNAGDGSGRLFVLEQAGKIRVIQDGKLLDKPFLDITDRVGSNGNERGLLGLAFHPDYSQNGYFYVNYTDTKGDTHIARFRVSADPNVADPSTETLLIFQKQPYANHNGGEVTFGPDGYLYLGLGDGGSAGDPNGNGQSTDTLLGKILRIDVNQSQGDQAYGIPPDNPFASGGGKPEIWAYGLRNPWRFSFDRLTGDLYIADVGQNQWEEIDFAPGGTPGGQNYGWNYREGAHDYQGTPPSGLPLVEPVAEYYHDKGCSVTGGYVYRGMNLPEWHGVYFYGDFCSGTIWGLLRGADGSWKSDSLFDTSYSITSFGEDENGEIYLVDRSGSILRLAKT
jgi:glucose/arabinose dehydrogenase